MIAHKNIDTVKIFVISYILWVCIISKKLGYTKSSQQQRIAWMYALRNGDGNKAVLKILEYLYKLFDDSGENSHNFTTELWKKTLDLVKPFSSILIAFDKITATQNIGASLIFHYDDFINNDNNNSNKMYERRNSEINGSANPTSQRADLFYVFRVFMRELILNEQSIFVSMSDTSFSMHNVVSQNTKSPLNSLVAPFSSFKLMGEKDFYEVFLQEYFFSKDFQHKEKVLKQLSNFRGRPHHFFTTFLQKLLAICEFSKPKNENELWQEMQNIFKESFDACVANIIKNILDIKWNETQSISSISLGRILRMIHMAILFSGGKVIIQRPDQCKDLISTGTLFYPDLSKNIANKTYQSLEFCFHDEPIIAKAILQYGNDKRLQMRIMLFPVFLILI